MDVRQTSISFDTFGRHSPPLKYLYTHALILLTSMTGGEAGTNINQEMSFFSGIPILLQKANLKKPNNSHRHISTPVDKQEVAKFPALHPSLGMGAHCGGSPPPAELQLLLETASWKDASTSAGQHLSHVLSLQLATHFTFAGGREGN